MSDDATAFTAAGYSADLAEAFEGRRLTVERVRSMTTERVLDEYLCWNGVVGYTRDILNALRVIERVSQK